MFSAFFIKLGQSVLREGFLIADSRTNGGVILLCAVRFRFFTWSVLVTKSIVVVCPRNGSLLPLLDTLSVDFGHF